MDIVKLLEFTDLFGGLSEKSKQAIAGIAIAKNIDKGTVLFSEGEKGFAVYLLARGSVELSKASAGREVVVRVVQPGEIFAEVILFEQDFFPVTARSLKKGIVLVLPKHQFHCLLSEESFRDDFIVLLMAKQRYLTERLKFLVSHDIDERFFIFIKQHYGTKEKIIPGISKKDMASAIGTVPETFSRMLLRLKERGLATWEGKELVLKQGFWEEFDAGDGLPSPDRKHHLKALKS